MPLQTYTPATGLTQPGQQIGSMSRLLGQVSSMPQQAPTQQQTSNITASAQQMQNQQPNYSRNLQSNLIKQSGIPQLQQQQTNLQNLFPLWLADQGFAQKYSSQQLQSPNSPIFNTGLQPNPNANTGGQSPVNNPYLASPDAIVAALSQPSGQGFQGFSSPGMNTQQMTQVPAAATNLVDQINSLLGGEEQLVGQQTQQGNTAYQNQLNDLVALAQAAQTGQAAGSPTGYPRGSQQEASYYFNSILDSLGANATPKDVWNYLNTHDTTLRSQGINIDALWAMQKDLAQKSPTTTATGKVQGVTTKKVPKKNAQGSWVMPNGTVLKEPFNIFGMTPFGGQKVDVASAYDNLKSNGYNDKDILDYFQQKGYSLG